MTKYAPLSDFLNTAAFTRLNASFAEIEAVLGFRLPKSAYTHAEWWSNNDTGHSHARSWLQAGWRTEDVDLAHRKVTLSRAPAPEASSGRRIGSMRGTFWVDPDCDLTAPLGEGIDAERGVAFRG